MIPSSRPVFNPPKPKTNFVDIPGSDWHLDLTEAVSGEITYEGRTGSFEFIVENGFKEWHVLYSEIMNYLHGKAMIAVLEDDPGYYYEGRFSVNQWRSDPYYSTITIDYVVNPYKMEHTSTVDDWKWDEFNFETGVIRYYKNIRVHSTMNIHVIGSDMKTTPLFKVTAHDETPVQVEYEGAVYDLPEGETRVLGIRIGSGEKLLKVTGNCTVSIEYRGGSL